MTPAPPGKMADANAAMCEPFVNLTGALERERLVVVL
jgi:hypothetical protein